jgi:hypothetical protein
MASPFAKHIQWPACRSSTITALKWLSKQQMTLRRVVFSSTINAIVEHESFNPVAQVFWPPSMMT